MVHTFHCLGKVFLVDVESGSIYEIDALTEKLIMQKISPDTISEGEFLCYSAQEIADAKEELEELEKAGMLFSPEASILPRYIRE